MVIARMVVAAIGHDEKSLGAFRRTGRGGWVWVWGGSCSGAVLDVVVHADGRPLMASVSTLSVLGTSARRSAAVGFIGRSPR